MNSDYLEGLKAFGDIEDLDDSKKMNHFLINCLCGFLCYGGLSIPFGIYYLNNPDLATNE